MSDPITTNLRFPRADYEELQLRARRRGVSMALLVREAVAQYLGRDAGVSVSPVGDFVDALVGAFPGGPDDDSVNHDHYLYGWPKESRRETPGGHKRAAGVDGGKRSTPDVGCWRACATTSSSPTPRSRKVRSTG